ncbi:hypothetical protein LOAG_00056 [Loa loa]|uniref:Uncharacterized protein n=1 Tax=Loa loa TaxID=7209 RepID=A0A1S0UE69_LOALO|nr:hypothetical protein LOAG_00056 [Loa loa]EFO28410.2 hypothetical protein LOAG_00056 [Loa loa]
MFAKLFNNNFTALQMAISILALILIILSLVIALNCYVECCCRGTDDLERCEEEEQQFLDKEYYDEICTLLYRHNQMEIKQMGEDWELKRKKETDKESTRHAKLLQETPGANSEKCLLLKGDLEPFKINHSVEVASLNYSKMCRNSSLI